VSRSPRPRAPPLIAADTDPNRDRVVSNHHLQVIVRHLDHPQLHSIVIPVLYNILNDYGKSLWPSRRASSLILGRTGADPSPA
jgi:hypothetical protein